MPITRFDVQPNPTGCGVDTTITVVVEFAGGPRNVSVTVHVPPPCTFTPVPAGNRFGVSPLVFAFQGRFACPAGQHHLQLRAVASGGDADQAITFATVHC